MQRVSRSCRPAEGGFVKLGDARLVQACENLLAHNITNLVCIGGDGSLTGANQFRIDWPGLLAELVQAKRISAEKAAKCANIQIVGMVGSIDNDFCGTDMTIGVFSFLLLQIFQAPTRRCIES